MVTLSVAEAHAAYFRIALTADELDRLVAAAPERAVSQYRTTHPGASMEVLEHYRRCGQERGLVYLFARRQGCATVPSKA